MEKPQSIRNGADSWVVAHAAHKDDVSKPRTLVKEADTEERCCKTWLVFPVG